MQSQRIKFVKRLGVRRTLDFCVDHSDHNFYAEGVVVSNSHAFCYSYLAATCTYLKANYTKEFFLSLLKYPSDNGDKKDSYVLNIKRELDFFGIELLPPSLIKGNQDFVIEDNKNIRFGLEGVKGLGEAVLKKLENFKPQNCNKFEFFQASRQAGLSCGAMASLIMSGAADEFVSETRSKLSFECLLFSRLKDKEKIYCLQNGGKNDWHLIEMVKNINEWADSLGKKISRKTRLNTLRKDTAKYGEIYKNNQENEDLTKLIYEKQNLGYNYSSSLKDIFKKGGRTDIVNLKEFQNEVEPNQSAVVVCHIQEVKTAISKKGNAMMKLFVEDETDTRFFYFAGQAYKDFLVDCNNQPNIKENMIVAIKLQKSKDGSGAFVQKIKQQGVKIMTKMADLKDTEMSQGPADSNEILPVVPEIPSVNGATSTQTELVFS